MSRNGTGAVFVQTNEADANRVLAFRRRAGGTLAAIGSYETGGSGDGVPHLTSQGSVVLTMDGDHLLVTNAGSGDFSFFAVAADGLGRPQTISSGGEAPKSAAEHAGLVYTLNTGDGDASVVGFRVVDERVEPLRGGRRDLPANSDPAQVGFSPDGSTLVVTCRGTDSIALHPVEADGRLGDARIQPSSGRTPYGFAFASDGTLVVTEAFGAEKGKAAASSYRVRAGGAAPVSRSIGNGRSEICWAVVSNDGLYLFATNFGDGAVSRYSIGSDGAITLDDAVAATAVEGKTGLRDEALTRDGKFLYAIDSDARRIFGWAVGDGGRLAPVGSWDGIPATAAGLAAR